ncbi:MAG: N-acetyltransferase [Chlorobium sp.]|uniref:GNAT family N-acetyltransferase n=1 Tax=Chlorobium sp. TaxID=1095 RepID=UPI0025BC3371|nr:N-acetyltransferase [Chlorobium sp.]MCF8384029.1 N-acetyltransferase [Chlorobium sp.]
MSTQIVIRDETHEDARAITGVTVAAFMTLEVSNHTEQFIIEALRAADALAVSLVAELDGRSDWFGLGPVSVFPELQRQGIGKTLIREGLERLKALGAKGCCLVGHPDYYRRFGFTNSQELVIEGVPQEVFFVLSFDGFLPQGTVGFHEAFMADGRNE